MSGTPLGQQSGEEVAAELGNCCEDCEVEIGIPLANGRLYCYSCLGKKLNLEKESNIFPPKQIRVSYELLDLHDKPVRKFSTSVASGINNVGIGDCLGRYPNRSPSGEAQHDGELEESQESLENGEEFELTVTKPRRTALGRASSFSDLSEIALRSAERGSVHRQSSRNSSSLQYPLRKPRESKIRRPPNSDHSTIKEEKEGNYAGISVQETVPVRAKTLPRPFKVKSFPPQIAAISPQPSIDGLDEEPLETERKERARSQVPEQARPLVQVETRSPALIRAKLPDAARVRVPEDYDSSSYANATSQNLQRPVRVNIPTSNQFQAQEEGQREGISIVLDGYLTKKPRFGFTWNRRRFVLLSDGSLLGFKTDRPPMIHPKYAKNCFDIKGAELFLRNTPKPKRTFIARCIELDKNSEKEKQFYTDTPQERDEWVAAIGRLNYILSRRRESTNC